MVTISCTPTSRARWITSAWSSANCGACRFTWLSISMAPRSGPGRLAQPTDGGEEGVGAVQVHRLHVARDDLQRLPGPGPAVHLGRGAGFRRAGGHGLHLVLQPVEQYVEPLRP